MENQTTVYILILTELTDIPSLQLLLFLVFLLIYFITLKVNFLILLIIFTDCHLHTPMYFFLGTLACLDMGYSSVIVPRMLFDLLTDRRLISVQACITQFYFFLFFIASEAIVLAVMSFDRYIAICRPLHYTQIMNLKVCVQIVSIGLAFGALYSLMHTLFLNKLTFCSSNTLQSFFCDLPQLLQISCSDTSINILLIYVSGILYGVVILGATFYPYITIIRTVLKIPSINMRSKAFSTCSSHLIVVFILYSTVFFNYLHPNANCHFTEDKIASVFYSTLPPFLNPLIYSMRNKELKTSLRKILHNSGGGQS